MNDTPEYLSLAAAMEQKALAEKTDGAVAHLRKLASAGQIETPEVAVDDGTRIFLSPTHPESSFLVKAGIPEYAPYQSAVLGLKPLIERVGDVWCTFSAGTCMTTDPLIIAWLEAHAGNRELHISYHKSVGQNPADCAIPFGLCRENGPGMDVWSELKFSQTPTSRRNATLSPEIDVDALVRGDYAKSKGNLTGGRGAEMEAAANTNAAARAERGG